MISEEEGLRDDLPRCLPGQVFVINQNSHQLRDGQCGVGLQGELKQSCTGNTQGVPTSLSCMATSDDCESIKEKYASQ